MSGLMGQARIQDVTKSLRDRVTTRRTELTTRFPQMGKMLPEGLLTQGGILQGGRPLEGIMSKIGGGKLLGQGGLMGQVGGEGGILGVLRKRPLGILGENRAFRTFGGGTTPTPGPAPGQKTKATGFRSFVR